MANETIDLQCAMPQRLVDLRARGATGLDSVEVSDDGLMLMVTFFGDRPDLRKEMVRISGGVRVREIAVVELRVDDEDGEDLTDAVRVFVDRRGDPSTYTLHLVELDSDGRPTDQPLRELDSRYRKVEFSFHAAGPTSLDCAHAEVRPPVEEFVTPAINYLAKDFASFRQLMLDRLALTMRGWTERHIPDIGVALVEVLAYVADYLSYYQDAVATEAYLSTARQRISVKRHVKLLDYVMHEGCNARAWIALKTSEDLGLASSAIDFVAESPDAAVRGSSRAGQEAMSAGEVFQPIGPDQIQVYQGHNSIHIYTWGNLECVLPKGAVRATLTDAWMAGAGDEADQFTPLEQRKRMLHLRQGDYLLFKELKGTDTGSPSDASPDRRQVVRLTKAEPAFDRLYEQPVVEIEWNAADALQFPLTLSSREPAPGCGLIENVSVAMGNIVLVDQGFWISQQENAEEVLGIVPIRSINRGCRGVNEPADIEVIGDRFTPLMRQFPLVFQQVVDCGTPAATSLQQDARLAEPQVRVRSIAALPDGSGPLLLPAELRNISLLAKRLLSETDDATPALREQISSHVLAQLKQHGTATPLPERLADALRGETERYLTTWTYRRDLLSSTPRDQHFTVETNENGAGQLRFGDGTTGRAPDAGCLFLADYRVSVGSATAFGSGVIDRIVIRSASLNGITLSAENPLSAAGVVAPEDMATAKLLAPGAYRNTLERAITADDYATIAQRHPGVQRAAATLEWTGTRYQVTVAIDPLGTDAAESALLREVDRLLQRFRRIGHDLVVVQAQYVPLDLVLDVEIAPDYLNAHVNAALLRVFSSGLNEAGRPGLFHPDQLTFGTSIYSSQLIAAAQAAEGVVATTVTRLRTLLAQPVEEVADGVLAIGPLAVARLDGDPTHPENGKLRIRVRGGR